MALELLIGVNMTQGDDINMPKETTPPKMTSMLESLCYDLNPMSSPLWIKVVPENWAQQNECFPNVQRKIEQDGGSAVNGWAIWQWGNIMIEAEAHSVWKSNSEELIDVTPHNYDERLILFVPDAEVKFEGIMIPSKRAPMTASSKVSHLLDLLSVKDYMLQQSGTSKVCEFPVQLLQEIHTIITDITQKASRNEPCPCGSGLKCEKCCGLYENI